MVEFVEKVMTGFMFSLRIMWKRMK